MRLGTLLLCTLFATTALAATDPRQRELKELRGRIDQLKKEIEQAKEDRAEAADSLKQSERRISDVNRALRELDQRQQGLSEELKDIQGNIRQTQRGLDNQQARLAELLRQHQRQGDADALKLLLSGKSPGETARDLEYYRHIGRARAELIRNHQASLDRLDALQRQAEERKDRIEKVKGERLQQRKDLEKEKKARQEVLTSLSQQIQQQRKQVASLVRDEKRLSQLIERLSRLALKPAKTLTAPGRKTSQVPDASLAGLDFAKLKGRLALPVAGTITARFGQAREGGGPSWKGVFIRAPEGQGVRVVASGRVAFADWLRGFGNLLVVDHGDGFLSLYSNNESLYKQVGDSVRAGDVVAAVGNTGGQSEHGLYFELRHQGKPFDPLSWVQ
ncbi:murein hydrolase activator EnvC family protein [Sulfuritortus calidifontis]|uniref:murein hydrolase activator EnvC family protein n=1 Tax=Sulfuritortus calidifontis TaxID=1914471 RepID=UPI001404CBC5|nr:peptidoglycan DD-metalloendopeptidase family protein [Sulfuritortus calidifontis]